MRMKLNRNSVTLLFQLFQEGIKPIQLKYHWGVNESTARNYYWKWERGLI